MKPQQRAEYKCINTFGFKKGADNYNECLDILVNDSQTIFCEEHFVNDSTLLAECQLLVVPTLDAFCELHFGCATIDCSGECTGGNTGLLNYEICDCFEPGALNYWCNDEGQCPAPGGTSVPSASGVQKIYVNGQILYLDQFGQVDSSLTQSQNNQKSNNDYFTRKILSKQYADLNREWMPLQKAYIVKASNLISKMRRAGPSSRVNYLITGLQIYVENVKSLRTNVRHHFTYVTKNVNVYDKIDDYHERKIANAYQTSIKRTMQRQMDMAETAYNNTLSSWNSIDKNLYY